jgi:nucleotide-binding universal stress UspA family protein
VGDHDAAARAAEGAQVAAPQPSPAPEPGEPDAHRSGRAPPSLAAGPVLEPGGDGPTHREGEVRPGRLAARGGIRHAVRVADIDPAHERRRAVHREDLAVVAAQPADEHPEQRSEDAHLAAGGLERRGHLPGARSRAPRVDHDLDADPPALARGELGDEGSADALRRERVHLKEHVGARGADRVEHRRVRLASAVEELGGRPTLVGNRVGRRKHGGTLTRRPPCAEAQTTRLRLPAAPNGTSTRTLRHAPRRGHDRVGQPEGDVMKRILVAVDGSESSLKAARMAADVALRFGSKLTLCHVVPKLLLPPDVYGLTIAEVEKEHRAYADRLLETAVATLDEPGIDISTTVLYGSPAEAIAEEAAVADVGLVVIGSRGHGAVARMFLGSVSDRIVHISPKPVLVVR